MFLPNERKIAFKSVVSVAIPTLVGEEWLKWIKMVMIDGDMNEIVELEQVINCFMPESFHHDVDGISYSKDGRKIVIWVEWSQKHTRTSFICLLMS